MTKHIAIDARGYSTSTGRYVRKLITNLEVLDKDNSYFILLKSQDWDEYSPSVDNFTKMRADFAEFTLAEQFGLKRLLNKLSVDVVHFTMPNQPIFYRCDKVTTIHDLTRLKFDNYNSNLSLYGLRKFIFKYVIKQVARQSSTVITPSEFVKNKIINFTKITPSNVIVTHEAADSITDMATPVSNLTSKQYLLYVGQAYSHKNLQNLALAFNKVRLKNPKLKLAIAGRKTNNHIDLENWIKEKNIKNTIFTDFIDDARLRWLYENAECYVLPSLSEGFGLPGLEAMVHGCPVVSSNATCLPEIYGEAAHYFNPTSVDDMQNKIQEVLDDKKLRNKLIKKGYTQIKKYSWEKMAKETLEVYKKALE